jgi:hypothetical protein
LCIIEIVITQNAKKECNTRNRYVILTHMLPKDVLCFNWHFLVKWMSEHVVCEWITKRLCMILYNKNINQKMHKTSVQTIWKHINYYICVTYISRFELVADKKDRVTNSKKKSSCIYIQVESKVCCLLFGDVLVPW